MEETGHRAILGTHEGEQCNGPSHRRRQVKSRAAAEEYKARTGIYVMRTTTEQLLDYP